MAPSLATARAPLPAAAAERFAALSPDLLATVDRSGALEWANPAWRAALADEDLLALTHPEDRPGLLAALEGAADAVEVRLRTRGGPVRWIAFALAAEGSSVHLSGRDVTDRRRREEERRAAEQRYRTIADATGDAIVGADADGRIAIWNDRAEALFGWPEDEILGLPLAVIMPERYRAAHAAALARLVATGAAPRAQRPLELEGLHRDGHELPLELTIGVWEHGGRRGFTALLRDVAERTESRRALRRAEARFAEAFAAAGAGIALAEPDGRITQANDAFCELAGRPEAELLGLDLDALTHAEDRGADDLDALLSGRERRLVNERRLVRPAGELVDVRVTLSAVRDPDGAAVQLVALVEDVTERRRMMEALTLSQARYGTLVRHLPDAAVVLFDRALRVHMVEGALLADAAELEGRPLADVLPPERVDELIPHFTAALAGEPRSFDHERLDGSATYWTQIVPLSGPDGAVFGGMAVFRDVTERRDAARALEERARELERSNAELEQYASVASHDLSEPLRMVSSYLSLLRRRHGHELGEGADRLIDHAVEGAARMRALIDDLLAYSRVGRDAPEPAPVDVCELVDEVADVVRATAPDADIVCELLPTVLGDRGQLGQLFQNLLGNAVKFVPEGRRPVVRVRAEGNRFVVEDNGIGIDAEHAERVFRMFQRAPTGEAFAGTGIGLAIARKVVEGHGGEIHVEPRPEGGSRFCFTLPVTDSTDQG